METKQMKRPALHKFAQQWEHFASEGHVLLEQADSYRHKLKFALGILSVAIVVGLLSQVLPGMIGSIVGAPVGFVVGLFDRKPKGPEASVAPDLKEIAANFLQTTTDMSTVPPGSFLVKALKEAAENMKTGKAIDGCVVDKKITDAWATQESFAPNCRYSDDKNRTWVWGVAGQDYNTISYAVLLRKDASGAVTISNIRASGVSAFSGFQQIDPALIPRTIASDLPELLVGAK